METSVGLPRCLQEDQALSCWSFCRGAENLAPEQRSGGQIQRLQHQGPQGGLKDDLDDFSV